MTKRVHDWVLPYVRRVEAYQPGKPVEEVEREYRIHAIKLASNENPLGPSPMAVEAATRALRESNRYPDGGGFYLRQKIAARHGVPMERVLLGLGSSELIDLAARVLLQPGAEGLTSSGSYPPYSNSIWATGATLVTAPLRGQRYDLQSIAEKISPRTRVIFLANPNNPTGTYFTAEEFDAFLARVPADALVVLDEAYFDYVGRPDYSRSIDLARRHDNLMVLRTFSKVYGMAGLRIGYAIGDAGFLAELNKLRTPFNTPGVAQAAALAAMDDVEHVRRSVETNAAGLAQLSAGLREMGAAFVPSVTNFMMIEVGNGNGAAVSEELLKRGVIVRPMGWMGFPGAFRVSVGTLAENRKFLDAFAEVRAKNNIAVSK